MSKSAIYIPRPGGTSAAMRFGYVDALRAMGWTVYVSDPKSKLVCRRLIEEHDISLIMTSSKYGIRQLPVDVINSRGISVFVDALPLNCDGLFIDDPYEVAHQDEPEILAGIESMVVHTRFEPHLWRDFFSGWAVNGIDLVHVPLAGNIIRALPADCDIMTDVAMIANFGHRQDIMRHLIEPLFKHLDLVGNTYQAFGDDIWHRAGLRYNGPLVNEDNRMAYIYATAMVCPNVHTRRQVELQAAVNDRSFMIPLCGGVQVSDTPLIEKYLSPCCPVAKSITDFMQKVVGLTYDNPKRKEHILGSVTHVANNHTYFHRLASLFEQAGIEDRKTEAERTGQNAAVRHCWEIEARLSAAERGVPYESQAIQ